MTKGWRIVDCTAMTGILRYKRGQLVIEHHDLETRIPLADTAVLLLGVQTTVSTALLQQLAFFDVEVLICQWNEIPIAAMQSWAKTNTRSAARQNAQQTMRLPSRKIRLGKNYTCEDIRPVSYAGPAWTGRRAVFKKSSFESSFRRPKQYRRTGGT